MVSCWIRPHLNERGILHLQRMEEQDICWDDSEWLALTQEVLQLEVEDVIEKLTCALRPARALIYHGCRAVDAGAYHKLGILRNDPTKLADQARRIVDEEDSLAHLRPSFEQRLREFNIVRDAGSLHLSLDSRELTNKSGHYVLYGSEWIQCVLAPEGYAALRRKGVPTILTVALPLRMASLSDRRDLARTLLQEWTRVTVNKPNWTPEIDLSFCIQKAIPRELIVNHFHPEFVFDWHFGGIKRRIGLQHCPSCSQDFG